MIQKNFLRKQKIVVGVLLSVLLLGGVDFCLRNRDCFLKSSWVSYSLESRVRITKSPLELVNHHSPDENPEQKADDDKYLTGEVSGTFISASAYNLLLHTLSNPQSWLHVKPKDISSRINWYSKAVLNDIS